MLKAMFRSFSFPVILALALALLAARAIGAQPQVDARGMPTLAPLVNEVTPAVVNISVITRSPLEDNPLFRDPFFRRFFNLPERSAQREE
jgi:S1-C subfamily serine protease